MAKENQPDTNLTNSTSNSLLNTCTDIQVTPDGADLIITATGTESYTAEITVTGTSCESPFTCYWDGQRWVCP